MRKLLFLFLATCSYVVNAQYSICGGGTATIAATSTLSNPQYSLAPNQGPPLPNNTWIVSPGVTTTYTIIATSGSSTQSTPVTVTVNPQPNAAPTVTNMTCNTNTAAYNLNLTFSPASPVPSYTLVWGGNPPSIPNGWAAGQTSGSGTLSPGVYTAEITAAGGCSTSVQFTIAPQPSPADYSLVPTSSVYSLTCNQPTINVNASNSAHTYTFYSTSAAPVTASAVVMTFSSVGTHTVTGTNTVSGCTRTYTFSVITATAAPQGTVNPAFQTISCANPVPQTVTLTATNPSVNITHSVLSNFAPTFITNNVIAHYAPGADTYTHFIINNVTGCSSMRTFTVAAAAGIPTFSVASAQNFTLGCAPKNFAVISLVNAATTPSPGGPVSFTLLAPGVSSVLPTGNLNATNVFTVTVPGTWTAVTRDNSNSCDNRYTFPITQNTFAPAIDSMIIPRNVLDCNSPTVVISGFSSVSNAAYEWGFPGGTVGGNSFTVTADQSAKTKTLIANYSLTVTDPNNACKTTTVIPMLQNLFPPIARIGSTKLITCGTSTVEITNQSQSSIPPGTFPINGQPFGFLWQGPTPQVPLSNSTGYVAFTLGEYTLTAKDPNNGCTSQTVATVGEDKVRPLLEDPKSPVAIISCSSSIASLTVGISTPTANLSYSWTAPANATTNPVTSRTLTTNRAGTYTVLVTNTVNMCSSTATLAAVNGTLAGSIEANRISGFAPLTVEFTNNSSYNVTNGTANASITTVWSFGNGQTKRTDTAQTSPVTVYTQGGTYTVTAFIFRGLCVDTAYQVINVELPSSLVVPNIFSPNGDNVNDVFFVKAVNLVEITFEVFNRWGQKVYSLTTDKGNVAWDGSNQFGDPAPEGTYLYAIRAKGSDGGDYDKSGTITLVR